VLGPWATLAAAGTFAAVVAVTRYVSLASIAAAVCFAVVQLVLLGRTAWTTHLGLGLFSVLVPVLIVVRHRANIGRLLRGTESKWGSRPAATTASAQVAPPGDANGEDGSGTNPGT
jgi:glycerol-3-phosphate acyltransferase PlsY